MALQKQVKIGGAYYQGFELIVSSTPGAYVLNMTQTGAAVVNSVSVVADAYGAGDRYSITHLTANTSTTKALIANGVYNPGANVTTIFDFPAFEPLLPNEIIRLTYTNTAAVAVNIHCIVEYVGMVRTA